LAAAGKEFAWLIQEQLRMRDPHDSLLAVGRRLGFIETLGAVHSHAGTEVLLPSAFSSS
jgi:hypothetical protein